MLFTHGYGIKIKDRIVKVPKHHFTVGVPCVCTNVVIQFTVL